MSVELERDKISIIVPVYNVESYVTKCIDCLINQTYKNLEIILVDDGSTDSSGNICDEYGKVDPRIQVIHQENKGLSGARNAGIDIASGEYIAFLDSDDYLDIKAYEDLYNAIKKDCSDMALSSFQYVNLGVDKEFNNDAVPNYDKTFTGYQILTNEIF